MDAKAPSSEYGAWNPGLESQLPRQYLPLSTIFNGDNVATGIAKAHELADYCGLPVQDLVAFRPERLIVHELLISVTINLSVPDGTKYATLGENFRAMASTILGQYIASQRDVLIAAYDDVKAAATKRIAEVLAAAFSAETKSGPSSESKRRGWFGFGSQKPAPGAPLENPETRDRHLAAEWRKRSKSAADPLDESCLHALAAVADAVIGRHGRLYGGAELLTEIAVTLVCNDYGSEVIGEAIHPYVLQAAEAEGYRPLPSQAHPVVMNVKGASASGKSTMRPLQRALAEKIDLPWTEFALISPDIWRKYLLDYDSLGKAYKYAGTLTGHEVEIIDKKLDLRMAAKAADGRMSHLLIDRFRFDSFVPAGRESSRLLTRFGELVYMFFMITPPEMTVERAWKRGLKFGRYKAVDDLLAHNVEAYQGMPELFFTWALNTGRRVHYEFLDNSVNEGERPRTVAYGWNQEMTILDVKAMLDIERFRKININAHAPAEVYLGDNLAPEANVDFLKRCARMIPAINFADYGTGRVYARLERGRWAWRDEQGFARALADPDTCAGLDAVAPKAYDAVAAMPFVQPGPADDKAHTLGAWGEAASADPLAGDDNRM
ncbi:MAG TPA: hypothetical protein VE224_12230 [Pseudolabrys sp.]|nr:hypothetical protein [Pseudolabrys sp.]